MPALLLVSVLAIGACGSDPQLLFTEENESNFLASCADERVPEPLPLDADAQTQELRRQEVALREMQNGVCECTITALARELTFARFAEFDAALKADLGQPLQPKVNQELAICVMEVGQL